MSNYKSQTKGTQQLQEMIVIPSTADSETSNRTPIRICWNTGEEKNCISCYLSKGCKAKA